MQKEITIKKLTRRMKSWNLHYSLVVEKVKNWLAQYYTGSSLYSRFYNYLQLCDNFLHLFSADPNNRSNYDRLSLSHFY